jgi:hypothetical protein
MDPTPKTSEEEEEDKQFFIPSVYYTAFSGMSY